jgi:hypothetical protein
MINCNPICVGIAMSVARRGKRWCKSEMAKPAIIIGTMSQDTKAVLSGLSIDILLKYQMEMGAVTRNTTHDSKKTSAKAFIFFFKWEEITPQIIIPIVAKTES